MAHPFHPLAGCDFEFVACRQNWGEDRVHLHDEKGDYGPFALVDQAAEDRSMSYPRRQMGGRDGDEGVVVWWPKVPPPVRPVAVIVRHVLIQDCPKVPLPGDQ